MYPFRSATNLRFCADGNSDHEPASSTNGCLKWTQWNNNIQTKYKWILTCKRILISQGWCLKMQVQHKSHLFVVVCETLHYCIHSNNIDCYWFKIKTRWLYLCIARVYRVFILKILKLQTRFNKDLAKIDVGSYPFCSATNQPTCAAPLLHPFKYRFLCLSPWGWK